MKAVVIAGLILAGLLTLVMIIWVGQVVRFSHSACQQYPYTSGCR